MQRRFTDDEVREIIGYHPRMKAAEIARLFDAPPSTIHNILIGKTYRDVTHDEAAGKRCECPACGVARQADLNLQVIDQMQVTVQCIRCRTATQVSVHRGLRMHGEISCKDCGRGWKK